LNNIRRHSDPKIYARLQEIASNFSALGSGLGSLLGPPFPKFLDPPLVFAFFRIFRFFVFLWRNLGHTDNVCGSFFLLIVATTSSVGDEAVS